MPNMTTSILEPADGYRTPARPLALCERPGDECRCPDHGLPTPRACPDCGGADRPPPRAPALLRFHWWCLDQAARHDRPGYPLLAFLFDWVGGRAADLYRWRASR